MDDFNAESALNDGDAGFYDEDEEGMVDDMALAASAAGMDPAPAEQAPTEMTCSLAAAQPGDDADIEADDDDDDDDADDADGIQGETEAGGEKEVESESDDDDSSSDHEDAEALRKRVLGRLAAEETESFFSSAAQVHTANEKLVRGSTTTAVN